VFFICYSALQMLSKLLSCFAISQHLEPWLPQIIHELLCVTLGLKIYPRTSLLPSCYHKGIVVCNLYSQISWTPWPKWSGKPLWPLVPPSLCMGCYSLGLLNCLHSSSVLVSNYYFFNCIYM